MSIQLLSRVRLCDPHGLSRPALLSMEFFRQEHWSGLPFPSPGDPPWPWGWTGSPDLQADFTVWATREAPALLQNKGLSEPGPILLSHTSLHSYITFSGYWQYPRTPTVPFIWKALVNSHHPSQSNPNINSSVKPSPRYHGGVTTDCVHTHSIFTLCYL